MSKSNNEKSRTQNVSRKLGLSKEFLIAQVRVSDNFVLPVDRQDGVREDPRGGAAAGVGGDGNTEEQHRRLHRGGQDTVSEVCIMILRNSLDEDRIW